MSKLGFRRGMKMAHGGESNVNDISSQYSGGAPDYGSSSKARNKKMQLSESVAQYLREQIISGKLQKGDFLRIDSIAADFGVSSTPVREGLLLLQSESFVQLMPRRGFVVTGFTREDLLDLFWTQATIGAELTARATQRMSDEDIKNLQELHSQHEDAVADGRAEDATYLGHQFHRAINLGANSPRMAQILGSLTRQLPNRFYASIEGQLKGAVDYHPMIIDAIRMKDADSARSLMFRHIYSAAEHLIAMFEGQGAWREAERASGRDAK